MKRFATIFAVLALALNVAGTASADSLDEFDRKQKKRINSMIERSVVLAKKVPGSSSLTCEDNLAERWGPNRTGALDLNTAAMRRAAKYCVFPTDDFFYASGGLDNQLIDFVPPKNCEGYSRKKAKKALKKIKDYKNWMKKELPKSKCYSLNVQDQQKLQEKEQALLRLENIRFYTESLVGKESKQCFDNAELQALAKEAILISASQCDHIMRDCVKEYPDVFDALLEDIADFTARAPEPVNCPDYSEDQMRLHIRVIRSAAVQLGTEVRNANCRAYD